MKNIKIFAAVLAVILLASCNRKVEFNHETFATFYEVGYSVNENVGVLEVPVVIYNPTGADVQVTVKGIDGKAVQGTDYEIVEPASGILNFSGATDSLAVKIEIKDDFVGEFTGGKDFKLQIASAIGVGLLNTANITILDLDHPLAGFIGSWSGVVESGRGGTYNMAFDIAADDTDPTYTKLVVSSGINHYFHMNGITATFSAVSVSPTQIALPAEQSCNYQNVILIGVDESGSQITDIFFELNEDGTMTLLNTFGPYDPEGWWDIYYGPATFTKK